MGAGLFIPGTLERREDVDQSHLQGSWREEDDEGKQYTSKQK
jgi:hypothetical protein